jgi:hypothetical protein
MIPRFLPERSLLSFLGHLIMTAGMLLAAWNLFFSAHHSWWLVAALIFLAGPLVYTLGVGSIRKAAPPSDSLIEKAFASVRNEQLRAITISFPPGWKYRKAGRGAHMFTIEECGHQAAIGIELQYLNETDINTLEGYLAYAVEFAKHRKSTLLFNKITRRWGMPVHEFADESPRTAGHRVTVPFHGTEYGFQLRLNDVHLAPAARRLFEKFLEHIRFAPPELTMHKGFGGSLFIGLPSEFAPAAQTAQDTLLWRSQVRQNCTVEITRLMAEKDAMSPVLLNRIIDRCPRPGQAKNEISKSRMTSLAENGFGGHIYFQATDTTGLFAAVGDLPTGGRYLFCLDDKDPSQEPYFGVYHYQQIAYEILVSMSEGSPSMPYSPPEVPVSFSTGRNNAVPIQGTSSARLDLDGRGLREFPSQVGQMTQLKELFLRNNFLQELPESIGNLTNLEVLQLSGNQLTSLPDSIAKLKKLRVFGISTNLIENLPRDIGEMQSLEEIHAGGNRLSSLPASLGKLCHLVKLNVCNNSLSSIPRELVSCPALKFLYLHDNPALRLSDSDLGPSWMEVRMGASPKPPKSIVESWRQQQG